ncbi:hypothetical protein I316_02551 [Kwoniella heveanensis BCC8398]|uniref:Aldehyde dehydrogenase domain-containing protein n=1 Tax=Kwoniella heveanensis BCC8398 TaxID=1296120 RepID=A0A1B9GWV0_9TREE|nr:hypothetical protein I316_02551 [Kwoniella heveanensis BCC8398]
MSFQHLKPGVYAPVLTFFKPVTEQLDVETFKKHVLYLAQSGVGPVITGSMGEGPMLSVQEQLILVKAAREVLDLHQFRYPLIVGASLDSTRETIDLIRKVAGVGADVVLVKPSGYFASLMTQAALKTFFMDIQKASPVPVMIYNFPGASGGVEMDSDLLLGLAKEGLNFCGAKLTCSQIGKITRLAGYCDSPEYNRDYPRSFALEDGQKPFVVFTGKSSFSDYLTAAAAAKGHGAIAGIGNFAPRVLRRLYDLIDKAARTRQPADIQAANELQVLLSEADYATTKLHIPGAKRILEEFRGYGGVPRQPIQPIDEAQYASTMKLPVVVKVMEMERSLAAMLGQDNSKTGISSDNFQKTISPVDQSVVVTRTILSDEELGTVVAKASSAFGFWKTTSLDHRLNIGNKFLEEMQKAKQQLSEDLSRQMGRPISHCAVEVDGTVARGKYMISISKDALADSNNQDTDKKDHVRFIKKCPVGPLLVISPWNYPYFCQVNAVLPAILAGNTVLLKPSPQTPLCGEWFVELFKRAGLPDGVIQAIHTTPTQSESLIKDPRVQFVMFTGSVANGHSIVKAASDSFKGVGLELGGKDPAYVREDADLAKVIPALADGIFFNAGQSCCSVERVYAHSSVYDRVVQGLAERAKSLKLGDPKDPSVTLGPVVSKRSADHIRKQVANAISAGGRPLISPEDFPQDVSGTNFVTPQVIADATHDMSLMKDETFGPVVGVMKVESDEEAIKYMNDSPFGLTASIWTDAVKSQDAFSNIVDKLETGTVYLNNADNLDPALAWSGWKDSGRGISLSKFGFDAYTRTKSVNVKYL